MVERIMVECLVDATVMKLVRLLVAFDAEPGQAHPPGQSVLGDGAVFALTEDGNPASQKRPDNHRH